jgi:methylenetetrahydrofolate dehydrogenase (NADP+)/methenyltetrahydrofolate cyclohydrolase
MTTVIIDGKAIAQTIKENLSLKIQDLSEKHTTPKMNIIHIGEDPGSLSYTKSIQKISTKLGIEVEVKKIEESSTNEQVIEEIQRLNKNSSVHGILVQEPIPSQFNRDEILLALSPKKDIDCMNPINLGGVLRGKYTFAPSTPLGVIKILEHENIETEGKHIVIVGRSAIVGKPLANLLLIKGKGGNATVTVCHSRTRDVSAFTKSADIIVAAVGKPRFITRDMVSSGAVVIDVGINYVKNEGGKGKLIGDVDFDGVSGIASHITPVPGGVGPVTTLMLLTNLIKAVSLNKE